jgi:hypothetical protein
MQELHVVHSEMWMQGPKHLKQPYPKIDETVAAGVLVTYLIIYLGQLINR